MDKIQLLQERKAKIVEASKEIRDQINELVDEKSFVEMSTFSFSKNEFYGEDVAGEGVVTGFATINSNPFYIVAQNFKVLSGGISEANCSKIIKCLETAEKNSVPVVYLLNTLGVQTGEGVTVLEGLSKLLTASTRLKKSVTQYVIVNGQVYGSAAMLAAIADVTFFVGKESVLAINSPFVLSAKEGKNLPEAEVGGYKALNNTGLNTVYAENLAEVKEKIDLVENILVGEVVDADLNECLPELNENNNVENIMKVFENFVELGSNCEDEVKTVLGYIGGLSVAAVIFDGKDKGVEITAGKIAKIKDFARFAADYDLPFITFTDVKGIEPKMSVNNSRVMKETVEYLEILNEIPVKVAVVYKQAVGLGYSLFAAKSAGFDYTCAFADAKIALFDSVQGAQIELSDEKADKAALAVKYADENSDPINAAKNGYIDAIIEPQFVKQYLIASIQMLEA